MEKPHTSIDWFIKNERPCRQSPESQKAFLEHRNRERQTITQSNNAKRSSTPSGKPKTVTSLRLVNNLKQASEITGNTMERIGKTYSTCQLEICVCKDNSGSFETKSSKQA